jgi:hypothetical protein
MNLTTKFPESHAAHDNGKHTLCYKLGVCETIQSPLETRCSWNAPVGTNLQQSQLHLPSCHYLLNFKLSSIGNITSKSTN